MMYEKVERRRCWFTGIFVALVLMAASAGAQVYVADGDTLEVGTGDPPEAGPVYVQSGGTLILSGGTISGGLTAVTAESGSTVQIHSGAIEGLLEGLWVRVGADVTFYGYSFLVNRDVRGPGDIVSGPGAFTIMGRTDAEPPEPLYSIVTGLESGVSVDLAGPDGGGGDENQAPVANVDAASTTVNSGVTIAVLDNDLDDDGDSLTVALESAPGNGTAIVNADGTVTYTPGEDFVGTDEFTYRISDGNGGTASATVTVAVNPGSLEIDIKPGDDTNRINLGSNGVIPVAILSAATFDATELDADKIFLAGAGVRVRGKSDKYLASEEDVNGDGLLDLVVKIETQNLDPDTIQDGVAYLRVHASADSSSAVLYEGSDSVTIVPPER